MTYVLIGWNHGFDHMVENGKKYQVYNLIAFFEYLTTWQRKILDVWAPQNPQRNVGRNFLQTKWHRFFGTLITTSGKKLTLKSLLQTHLKVTSNNTCNPLWVDKSLDKHCHWRVNSGGIWTTNLSNIVFPGAMCCKAHSGGAHAMVCIAKGNNIKASSIEACHHHSHVICFGARIDKIHHLHHTLKSLSTQS